MPERTETRYQQIERYLNVLNNIESQLQCLVKEVEILKGQKRGGVGQ